jgi:hypothetical protein
LQVYAKPREDAAAIFSRYDRKIENQPSSRVQQVPNLTSQKSETSHTVCPEAEAVMRDAIQLDAKLLRDW